MTGTTAPQASQHTQVLDRLFSHLAAEAAGRPLPVEPHETCFNEASAAEPGEFAEAQPLPRIENTADLQAAHAWLLRERQRLEMYTRGQLARIQKEHQAFVQQAYLKEQALVLRTQEFNRKEEMLAHQFGVLRQQAGALAERERKLAPYLDPLWQGQAELEELRKVSGGLKADVKGQRALLARLQSQTASLEKERAEAQAELTARGAALQEEEGAVAARQAQMNQRLLALDEAEAATRRRAAELEELEARLRRDFEDQEGRLTQLRRVSVSLSTDTKGQQALLERLRAEAASLERARDTAQKRQATQAAAIQKEKESLAARQDEMNRRLQALEAAEAGHRRRAAELEEMEERMHRDFEEQERGLDSPRREVLAADPCTVQR